MTTVIQKGPYTPLAYFAILDNHFGELPLILYISVLGVMNTSHDPLFIKYN